MIDGKPRIGDEVYIHGYIDEIRKDVVIIRNEGGCFGTSDKEMFYYEEDERGYGTMNDADRKDEPQTEECYGCIVYNGDGNVIADIGCEECPKVDCELKSNVADDMGRATGGQF